MMKKRIFRSLTVITIISTLVFNISNAYFMYNQLSKQRVEILKSEASNISQTLSNTENIDDLDIELMSNFTTSNRITLISTDGIVLYDNYKNSEIMENHLERPEVQSALKNGFGEDSRLSETLGEKTFYYAILLENNYILRVSFTDSSIYSVVLASLPIYIALSILLVLLITILSSFLSYLIVRPIDPKNPNIYDELLPFVKKIETQQSYIDNQRYELEQRIIEFDAISKNIADGLILLDTNGNILSINQQAVDVLGHQNLNYVSKPFIDLTRIIKIQEYIERAFRGEFVDKNIKIQNKFFSFRISPVIKDGDILGVVVLIIDNTNQIETEQIRREFSANVSHELKTPLTSISGYAELIKSGMVRPEDIVPFAENIWNETAHLIELIEDIIKVSKLDEGQDLFEFSPIDLKTVIENNVSRLTKKALSADIEIKTILFSVKINAVKSVINEIFYNLIENSIKYNKNGGFVSINMSISNEFVIIDIEDNGIGIPSTAQERIFERFYRADTSHSSEISGSGLGLSIVKHGVQLHHGTISVKSTEHQGTTFTLSFKL